MVFQFYGFIDVILIIFVFGMLTNLKKREKNKKTLRFDRKVYLSCTCCSMC